MKTREHLGALLRRQPLLADSALAAVVLALSLPPFTSLPGRHQVLAAVLVAAIACPLAWRRRAPFAVLLIITVPGVLQIFTGQQITDFLAFLVAFYTVAACSRPLFLLIAAVLLEAGTTFAAVGLPVAGWHAVLVWALATGLLAVAGLLGYYVRSTRQARAAAEAERARQQDCERAHQAQLAVSAERARIAREMHDIVAHNIAVMIALADGASVTSARDPGQAAGLMEQVSATGRTALTEMRRLLGVLREPVAADHAPQPALSDLDDLLATFEAAGLRAELSVSGQPHALPPSAELAVYRIVTEGLTATGLPGMRERAAVFGGQVTAGPGAEGGWQVHAVLEVGT